MVLLDELVPRCRVGAVAGLVRRIDERRLTRSPLTGGAGHDKRPCHGRGRKRLCKIA